MKKDTLIKITKSILDILFFSGWICCLGIPFIFKAIGDYYPNIKNNYIAMCVLFIISGILAVLIINELRNIFNTVIHKNCFIQENVISLKRMGFLSFSITIVTGIRLLFVITPATIVIMLVFFIAGLFSLVLAQVFEEAIKYKIENDLTI